MNETPHYYAFISYSHEDKNLVAAFHDRLENYEIPFYFRKKRKKIPATLTPIFRDETDLNIRIMTEEIGKALKNSDSLIIFCSKASQHSSWVEKEIELFKKFHHKGECCIVVIVVSENGEKFSGTEYYPSNLSKDIYYVDSCCIDQEWERIICKLVGVDYTKISRRKRKDKHLKNNWIVFILCMFGVLGGGGYAYWGKEHYRYYEDWVDCWGVPKGINELSPRERKNRNACYRFAIGKGKIREIAYVNSYGKIMDPDDTEYRDRVAVLLLFYLDKGKIKVQYRNAAGILLKLCTISGDAFDRYDFWTPMGDVDGMSAFQTDIDRNLYSFFQQNYRAQIGRYFVYRSKNGYIQKLFFRQNNGNEPVTDADGIAGFEYERNSLGQVTVVRYLGVDNRYQSDRTGIAKRQYSYDPVSGQMERAEYFGLDGKPVLNKRGWSVCVAEINKYGNIEEERYLDNNGQLCIGEEGCAFCRIDYDEGGNKVKIAFYGTDGELCIGKDGFAIQKMEYDKRGNMICVSLFDASDRPCYNHENIAVISREYNNKNYLTGEYYYGLQEEPVFCKYGYASTKFWYDDQNRLVGRTYYDTFLQLCYCLEGYAERKWEYDIQGRIDREKYFGTDAALCYNREGVAEIRWKYKDSGTVSELAFFDVNGNPCYHKSGMACIQWDSDLQGHIVKVSFYGTDSLPCLSDEGVAGFTQSVDSHGLVTDRRVFGTDGYPCYTSSGIACIHWDYNTSGFATKEVYRDMLDNRCFNKEGIGGWEAQYDEQNNLIEKKFLDTLDRLCFSELHIAILSYEYDRQKRMSQVRFLDTERKPCYSTQGLAGYTCQYDAAGNVIRKACLGVTGELLMNYMGYAGYICRYNEYHLPVAESYFDAQEKPCKGEYGCEMRTFSYDERRRLIEIDYRNAAGNLCLNQEGYAFERNRCDELGRVTETWFFNTDSLLCVTKKDSVAGIEYKFDKKNRLIEVWNKGINGSLCMSKQHFAKVGLKSDRFGTFIECTYYDTLGNLCLNAENIAIMRRECNEQGYLVKEYYLGTDSLFCMNVQGVAGIDCLPDRCGRTIEKTFFDTAGYKTTRIGGVVKCLYTFGVGDRIQTGFDIRINGDTTVTVPVAFIRMHTSSVVADTFFILRTDTWKFGDYYAYFDVKKTKTYKIQLLDKQGNSITAQITPNKKGGNTRCGTLNISIRKYRELLRKVI